MKLKRSAVCALLSLVLSVQAAGFEAAAAPEAAPPPAAQVSVAAETADESSLPQLVSTAAVITIAKASAKSFFIA